jgi:CRISPR-associated endonuclease Csn1
LPVVKEFNEKGWPLLFTLKQNEMFVFPSADFDPFSVDLSDNNNNKDIAQHLFRVQKISKATYGNSSVRDYVFRHHLESEVKEEKVLKDVTWKPIKSLGYLQRIVKVRINHIGQIVQIGEY